MGISRKFPSSLDPSLKPASDELPGTTSSLYVLQFYSIPRQLLASLNNPFYDVEIFEKIRICLFVLAVFVLVSRTSKHGVMKIDERQGLPTHR